MNRNVRIARELIRMAKMLVAFDPPNKFNSLNDIHDFSEINKKNAESIVDLMLKQMKIDAKKLNMPSPTQDAEDANQVFAQKLYKMINEKSFPEKDDRASVGTFLKTIARNVLLDMRDHQNIEDFNTTPLIVENPEDGEESVMEVGDEREQRLREQSERAELVRLALQQFDEQEKRRGAEQIDNGNGHYHSVNTVVIYEKFLNGKKSKEIAKELFGNEDERRVDTIVSRTLPKLGVLLDRLLKGDESGIVASTGAKIAADEIGDIIDEALKQKKTWEGWF